MGTDNGTSLHQVSKYQQNALEYEADGLLREAMLSWWIVLHLQPGNAEAKEKIASLRKRSLARAGAHYARGVEDYHNGRFSEARKEFLLTLAFQPYHKLALEYLKEKMQPSVFKTYVVQRGDTVEKIAAKELGDQGKAVLLTAFNEIDGSGTLPAGALLQIPLVGKLTGGAGVARSMVRQDKRSLSKSGPEKNVAVTGSAKSTSAAMTKPEVGKKGGDVHNAEKYQRAKALLEQEEYLESLKLLRSIDADYRDVRELRNSTEVFLQQEADAHYRQGISYFLSEDLVNAIKEWEETLRLMPNHLKAKKDLQNARKLLERVEKSQAVSAD